MLNRNRPTGNGHTHAELSIADVDMLVNVMQALKRLMAKEYHDTFTEAVLALAIRRLSTKRQRVAADQERINVDDIGAEVLTTVLEKAKSYVDWVNNPNSPEYQPLLFASIDRAIRVLRNAPRVK